MLIEKGIRRVVIGCEDPFVKVHGRGIQKLLTAGCEVKVGVLEKECRQLIRKFITFNTVDRPYVTLKWAESADGFIGKNRCRTVLSTPLSTLLVQKRRTENDAIMVGTETARIDNPQLTLHGWYGKNPIRVVLDRKLSLPRSIHLFDGSVRTLVFTTSFSRTDSMNLEYIVLLEKEYCLSRFLKELAQRNIQSLLVEGGAQLHQSFIDEGLWDEAYVEKSVTVLGGEVYAPQLNNIKEFANQRVLGVDIFKYIHRR
jgi:diaminohydroxyphosphoribosylaminopyrimidine deaminase/5-amino-6-(5-phosphoribosylamino)uracil reductase